MAVYPSQAMLTKNTTGSLNRKRVEERTKSEALPQGKGGLGSLSRELVQEPIDRPVAPGAKKVVGVKPAIEEANGGMGFLPASAQSVPGEVSGPEGMGMFAKAPTSGGALRSSNKVSGSKSPVSAPAQNRSVAGKYGTPVAISAPKAQSGASKQPKMSFISGGPIADLGGGMSGYEGTPEQIREYEKATKSAKKAESQRPSEQAKRAASTKLNASTIKQSVKTLASNPKAEASKAVKGLVERAKETVTNTVKGSGSYNRSVAQKETAYQKAQKAVEKAKSVLRSVTKGLFRS